MDHNEWVAGDGQLWVCAACGRSGKHRDRLGDTSCFLNAVLCKEDSIVRNEPGKMPLILSAEAVEQ